MDSKAILDLMNDEANDEMVKDAIAFVMEYIQRSMVVAHLPEGLLEIMNMWARMGWYDEDGDSKFEKCLWKVVSRELKTRVYDLLKEWMNEDEGKMPEKKDLYYALNTASNSLYYHKELWSSMGAELETEAMRWVLEHNELILIESCDGGYFQYYDSINEEVCYQLPHIPKPNRFSQYEEKEKEVGWVCVGVNTLVPC